MQQYIIKSLMFFQTLLCPNDTPFASPTLLFVTPAGWNVYRIRRTPQPKHQRCGRCIMFQTRHLDQKHISDYRGHQNVSKTQYIHHGTSDVNDASPDFQYM